MNLRVFSLTLVLAFVLLAAFAVLNWPAMAGPSTLSLGFADVSAPLGMVMLVFTAAISGLFVVYIVLLQASVSVSGRCFHGPQQKPARADLRTIADSILV